MVIINSLILTLLLVISYEDVKYRKIYNKRVVLLLLLLSIKYLYELFFDGAEFHLSGYEFSIYLAISLFFFALGAFRLLGMGDVKLIMIMLIFIEFSDYKLFLFHMTLIGGVLAVLQLKILNHYFDRFGFSSNGVPYAIPIIASYVIHSNTLFL
ncbi:prepilin peptidase [Vibrio owensii]|uniref:prepilin peptidase n=1 Tax=Vibrio owensii TaxID=696485 RepID=UPI00391ADD7C